MRSAAEPRLVPRFGRSERVLHWVHALGFTAMFSSGLALFLPSLTSAAGGRPLLKAVHLGVAAMWAAALLAIALGGDRRALRKTRRELEAFGAEDAKWLRRRPSKTGRFNAGQKAHAVAQAALAALFVVSGALLWLGERNNAFKFPGSLALHDVASLVAGSFVVGHVLLAVVWPATRPALRGMVRGSVRADWARVHHPGWTPATHGPAPSAGRVRGGLAALVLAAGLAATVVLARGSLSDTVTAATPAPPVAASAPAPADADALLARGTRLSQDEQRVGEAIEAFASAAELEPRRADIRAALGFAFARFGNLDRARTELSLAVELDDAYAPAHLFRGLTLLQADERPAGRRALRRFLELEPSGPDAEQVRVLLDAP